MCQTFEVELYSNYYREANLLDHVTNVLKYRAVCKREPHGNATSLPSPTNYGRCSFIHRVHISINPQIMQHDCFKIEPLCVPFLSTLNYNVIIFFLVKENRHFPQPQYEAVGSSATQVDQDSCKRSS